MQGVIIQSTGSWYEVLLLNGTTVSARLKGVFRKEELKRTNPLAVGDNVMLEEQKGDYMILEILPRKNYIIRDAPHKTEHQQIIASNLDLCVIIASVLSPKTSSGFIDRILLTADAFNIQAVVILNKSDLIKKIKDKERVEEMIFTYTEIGHHCFTTSVTETQNLEKLIQLLKNKTSLLCGHSGAGKTSLINAIEPTLNLRVQKISEFTEKGQHTTTFARMYPLSFGGNIIDTPGIKEFGISEILSSELSQYFPEMRSRSNECRFNDCKHINEKGCAIIGALEEGLISPERYKNYLTFYNELTEKEKW